MKYFSDRSDADPAGVMKRQGVGHLGGVRHGFSKDGFGLHGGGAGRAASAVELGGEAGRQRAVGARPLVSIITPIFDAERFLPEAVESVLAQTYPEWELLLVNDGSADRSGEIARRYAALYPARIRVLEHEGGRNRGLSASRNLGLRHAAGRYLTFLDADDVYLPHAIEREVAVLEARPEAAAVCGNLQFWYGWTGDPRDARRDFVSRLKVPTGVLHRPPHLLVHALSAGGRKPGISSVMVRRETVEAVGAFEEVFRDLGEDRVFWAKVSLNAPVFVTDVCLVKYRQHADSLCAKARREGKDFRTRQLYLDWLASYLADEGVDDPAVWRALDKSRRDYDYQLRFAGLKQLGRRVLSLRTRYWLLDKWLSLKSVTGL
jgi:glycosyltransferase involved in cell wall biosynthesis